MTRPYGKQPVFYPHEQADGGELLIVEGDSAAKSIDNVRNLTCQAILALQGKPANATRGSLAALMSHAISKRFVETISGSGFDPSSLSSLNHDDKTNNAILQRCRFETITIVMDPDADGIHCGVLLMGYFWRLYRWLIDEDRIRCVHPPMSMLCVDPAAKLPSSRLAVPGFGLLAQHPEHAQQLRNQLNDASIAITRSVTFRGLGSMPPAVLRQTCIDPSTRWDSILDRPAIKHALTAFGHKTESLSHD
ncbi:MAG: toprim domain-containing protein [Planctomycetota bacterium]